MHRLTRAIAALCEELNQTKTIFPGCRLRPNGDRRTGGQTGAGTKKHLTNLIKMVAYQAESDLLRLVAPHYRRAGRLRDFQIRRTMRGFKSAHGKAQSQFALEQAHLLVGQDVEDIP